MARYSGLRYRGDGSGYKLPFDVRLRMPLRPGEKKANVDIARVKSAEEGAVAFDLGTAWRQLHPTAGGGAPSPDEYNFPVEMYRQNIALWSRLRAARSLGQLRNFLTQLRNSRMLEHMAAQLVGQEQRAMQQTPPQESERELQQAEASAAAALISWQTGGSGAMADAPVARGAGRARQVKPARKRGPAPAERPAKRAAAGAQPAQQAQHGCVGGAFQPMPDVDVVTVASPSLAPFEGLRQHLEQFVELPLRPPTTDPCQPPFATQEVEVREVKPQPYQQEQPLMAQPGQQQQQQVEQLVALLQAQQAGVAAAAQQEGGAVALAMLAALLRLAADAGVHPSDLGAVEPAQFAAAAPCGVPQDAVASGALAAGSALPAAQPWVPPVGNPAGSPAAWQAGAAQAAWGTEQGKLEQHQHDHIEGLLRQLLLAAQQPTGAAAGLTPQLAALYMLALERVPEEQQQQQAVIMGVLLRAGLHASVVALAGRLLEAVGLTAAA